METKRIQTHCRALVIPALLVLALILPALPLAAEEPPPRARDLFGITMGTGRGLLEVLAEPAAGAASLGALRGLQPVVVLAVTPRRHGGSGPPASESWALLDLAGARGNVGDSPFGWVPLESLRDTGLTPAQLAQPAERREFAEYFWFPSGSLTVVFRAPGLGEDPVPIIVLDLKSGQELILGRYYHESRIVTMVQESGVLITSAGTGPGSPEIIELTDTRTGRYLYSGHTWKLHDAVREERFVRVIPSPPDRSWRDAAGILRDPEPRVLEGPPWFFDAPRIGAYEALQEEYREDAYVQIWIVPQVWVDTLTGETGPIEFSIERYFDY